jgi:membrane protein implicated in regulation of membrane protease activity
MESVSDLAHSLEVETEKLAVARHLGWWIALFAAIAAYLAWDSLFIAFVVLLFVYAFAIARFAQRHARAKKAMRKARDEETRRLAADAGMAIDGEMRNA